MKHTLSTKLRPFAIGIISTFIALSVSACGYQLRSQQNLGINNSVPVVVTHTNQRNNLTVATKVANKLDALGIFLINTDNNSSNLNHIDITNIKFQDFQLTGILTEVRVTLTADITYQIIKNGHLVTIPSKTLYLENSYQYNAASVSFENQQKTKIKEDLLELLSQRITDQYISISQQVK